MSTVDSRQSTKKTPNTKPETRFVHRSGNEGG